MNIVHLIEWLIVTMPIYLVTAIVVLAAVWILAAAIAVWLSWMSVVILAIRSKENCDWSESDSPKGETVPGVRYQLCAAVDREQKR